MIKKKKLIYSKGSKIKRESKLYNHRCFNNWIKSVLISDTISKLKDQNPDMKLSILDLGCGKGGDLNKYKASGIDNYFGIDISIGQLRDALFRKINGDFNFPCHFIKNEAECEPEQFFNPIPKDMYFDLISAQFCIHYFFQSEKTVENFLENISRKLTKGGYFVATFPDWKVITKKMKERGKITEEDFIVYENNCFSLIIKKEDFLKQTPYGIKYGFFLDDDLVGTKRENKNMKVITYVPEYLVILENFLKKAEEYGFVLEETENFHDFYASKLQVPRYFHLFKKMKFKFTNDIDLMDKDSWDTSYLYRTICLKKIKGVDPKNVDRDYKKKNYFKLVQ